MNTETNGGTTLKVLTKEIDPEETQWVHLFSLTIRSTLNSKEKRIKFKLMVNIMIPKSKLQLQNGNL